MTMLVFLTLVSLTIPHALSGIIERSDALSEKPIPFPLIADRQAYVRTDPRDAPNVTADAAGVWDPSNKTFLYEKNVHEVLPIASMTKLMTALVALERGVDLDADVTIVNDDADPAGSSVELPVGSVVTGRDLLRAMLIASGNNAAEAFARASGLEESAFVREMNMRAGSLGMTETRFTDVTGLGPTNRSTVLDLMKLLRAAFRRNEIVTTTTQQSADIHLRPSGKTVSFRSTNQLLGSTLPITGGKTGTYGSGATLGFGVRNNAGNDVYVVVLGSSTSDARFSDGRSLAEWVLHSFHFSP